MDGISLTMELVFLDDVLVHGTTFETHLVALEKVLAGHGKAGLKLKPAKYDLFAAQVEYLGNMVSAEGIQPAPTLLNTIKQWPCPKTRTEVRVFLGKDGYY